MNQQLISLLKCPHSGEPLTLNGEILISKQHNYPIKNGIPVLLPQVSNHNSFNMEYVEHYTLEHERSDYFAELICHAQADDERRVHEYIISQVPTNAKHILDVGSGGAWVARHFCPKGVAVTSFDITLYNVQKALSAFPFANHTGIVGDALNLPLQDNSFDCIISSEVIEHTVEPSLFVARLFQALKPNGVLIITTPYKEVIRMETCVHCNCETPRNAHLHSFDEQKLGSYSPNGTFEYCTFGNKALILLRSYFLTRILPFGLWKLVDGLVNVIINRRGHILAKYSK